MTDIQPFGLNLENTIAVCPTCKVKLLIKKNWFLKLIRSKYGSFICPKCKRGVEKTGATWYKISKKEQWVSAGNKLFELHEYAEALDCYLKALQIDSHYYKAISNAGSALFELGEYKLAVKFYEEVLEIEPNDAKAKSNKELAQRKLTE